MSQGNSPSIMTRLVDGRWGPTRLALALGVCAIQIVAVALQLQSTAPGDENLPDIAQAVVMATISVLGAALVGGWLGGRLLGRMTVSPLVAVGAAWFVGASLLTVAPGLFGIQYRAMPFCLDGCQPMLDSAQPISGALYWGLGMVFGVATVLPATVALALLIVSRKYMHEGQIALRAATAVVAYGAFWGWGMLGGSPGAIVVYVPLAVGVVIWTVILRRWVLAR